MEMPIFAFSAKAIDDEAVTAARVMAPMPRSERKLANMSSSLVVNCWTSLSGRPPFLHEDGQNDDRALDRAVQMRAEPRCEIENVLDEAEDEDADDCSPDPAIPARQHGSTDDDGRDGFEFPKDPGGRRSRTETRHIDEGRHGHTQTLENVRGNPNPAYIDGRILCDR